MDIKLFQCFHDHGSMPPKKYISNLRPALLCGASIEWRQTDNITDCLRDNVGDNISLENQQYSELTGYYWVWKNTNHDIIGIEHYRRHFIKPNRPIDDYVHTEDLFDENDIINALSNHDFIIPVHESLANTSVYDLYVICFHEQADQIVKWMREYFKDQPNYLESLFNYMSHNRLVRANMLITRKEEYDKYCETMFTMIDYLKQHIPVEKPDSRVWGYITELFPAIYIDANKKSYIEVDMAVDDFNQDIQKDVVYVTYNKKEEDFSQKNPEEQIEYFKSL